MGFINFNRSVIFFSQKFFPFVGERRVNCVRLAVIFSNFIFFKNHLVFEIKKINLFRIEKFLYFLISFNG